jgi:hypothetical protein
VRVYLPTTIDGLRDTVAAGGASPELVRFTAAEETEEAEYDALMGAADVSAELLEEPGRRVVVVADVDDEDGIVALRDVVAVHADVEDIDPDDAGAAGDLGWFATQEIGALLAADEA